MRGFVGERGLTPWFTVNVLPAIVRVPTRATVPVFSATTYVALPFPEPDPVTVIQETPLADVHVQPACDVTVMVPLTRPFEPTTTDSGVTVNVQAAPACVTVKVLPAIVSVPVRLVVALFAATLKVTVPPPDPDAPAVIASHEALLAAVHAHVVPTLTVVLPVPAAAVKDWLEEESDGAHGTENEKVLVRVPPLFPPGPTASTSAS